MNDIEFDDYNESCYSHESFEEKYKILHDKQIKSLFEEYISETSKKKIKYILDMFPYPSGNLHIGHVRNYTITDVLARGYHLMGEKIFRSLGWDAFGLPAENAARQHNVSPRDWTNSNIKNMSKVLDSLFFLDYRNITQLRTNSPDYYKHQQSFMIDLFKRGILYRKKSFVNWDPVDKTVLANEQIDSNGKGWRSGAVVEKKELWQWFLKISNYSKQLLNNLPLLKSWPLEVRQMQKNWIGQSIGCYINFTTENDTKISVFTTKPETIFGCTFLASAKKLEHNYVIHPFTGIKIPILQADYVYEDYGTGIVMGVPSGDERDKIFAIKNNIKGIKIYDFQESKMINSDFLNELNIVSARNYMFNNHYKKETIYRLRDWCISRQRAWGCPMPFIHCENCGILPLKNENLPVELPETLVSTIYGNILEDPNWKSITCYKCGNAAQRDSDTMDTFVDSAWYFLRYPSFDNKIQIFDERTSEMMPVDIYVGGVEHAVLHLLYARFISYVLQNKTDISAEPFKELITQGMVIAPAFQGDQTHQYYHESQVQFKEGKYYTDKETVTRSSPIKMSKSKKNTGSLIEDLKKYGIDAMRLYLMSNSPCTQDFIFSHEGLKSTVRFLNRVWAYFFHLNQTFSSYTFSQNNINLDLILKYKSLEMSFKSRKLNIIIAHLHKLFSYLKNYKSNPNCSQDQFKSLLILFLQWLWCFCPVISEACYKLLLKNILDKNNYSKSIFDSQFVHITIEKKKLDSKKIIRVFHKNKYRGFVSIQPDTKKDAVYKQVCKKFNITATSYVYKKNIMINIL